MTGVPCNQKDINLEKASVLFNIGALYSQIGTRQDRSTPDTLDSAVDNFLRAAGIFQYIQVIELQTSNESDLEQDFLTFLVRMVLAQAKECLLERAVLSLANNEKSLHSWLRIAMEAVHVSNDFSDIVSWTSLPNMIPNAWQNLIKIKREYYRAVGNWHVAQALACHQQDLTEADKEAFQCLYDIPLGAEEERPALPTTKEQKNRLSKESVNLCYDRMIIHL